MSAKNNTSGVSGVHFDTRNHKWKARISKLGKRINLGSFDTFQAAVQARQDAELEMNISLKYERFSKENFSGFPHLPVLYYMYLEGGGTGSEVSLTPLRYASGVAKILALAKSYDGSVSFLRYVIENFSSCNEVGIVSDFPELILGWLGCSKSIAQIARENSLPFSSVRAEIERFKNKIVIV